MIVSDPAQPNNNSDSRTHESALLDVLKMMAGDSPSNMNNDDPPDEAEILFMMVQVLSDPSDGWDVKDYLDTLHQRASEDDQIAIKLTKFISKTFNFAIQMCFNRFEHCREAVFDFMLNCLAGNDEDAAYQAANFWEEFCKLSGARVVLEAYFERLVPALFKNMVRSEKELNALGYKDLIQSNAPTFTDHEMADSNDKERQEDEWLTDDEDEGDFDPKATTRNMACATLDLLSNIFSERMVGELISLIDTAVSGKDLLKQETGILAVGAIGDACAEEMDVHLPHLLFPLIDALEAQHPMFQATACWTLSRYTAWLVEGISAERNYFDKTVLKLLALAKSEHLEVRKSSFGALASMTETTQENMKPYLRQLGTSFNLALEQLQDESVYGLYDAIVTLAGHSGDEWIQQGMVSLLVEPLVQKYRNCDPEDLEHMIYLLECLKAVALASGSSFVPFAEELWKSCFQTVIKLLSDKKCNNDFEEDDEEEMGPDNLLALTLGMLDSIVVATKENCIPFTKYNGKSKAAMMNLGKPKIVEVLLKCLKHESPEVRSVSLAFLGDLVIHAFTVMEKHLSSFIPIVYHQIATKENKGDEAEFTVAGNALWAFGEIAIRLKKDKLQSYLPALLPEIISIITQQSQPDSEEMLGLKTNACVAFARIGIENPGAVAPFLGKVCDDWSQAMVPTNMAANVEEKESAFAGMVKICLANPHAVRWTLVDLISKYEHPSQSLEAEFFSLFKGLQSSLGSKFSALVQQLPQQTLSQLRGRYNLN